MNTFLKRTITGAVYVGTIVIPLLILPGLYPWIIMIYGILTFDEFHRLMSAIRQKKQWNHRQFAFVFGLLALLWIVIPFSAISVIPVLSEKWVLESGKWIALSMYILVWTHDTFAYLTGRLVGRHPLFPAISPAKTIEGAIGGALFTLGVAFLLSTWFSIPGDYLFWGGNALIAIVFSTYGDLAESKLKRLAGVKDSGNILPGHGGTFDRFDALLLVAPFWLLWTWCYYTMIVG